MAKSKQPSGSHFDQYRPQIVKTKASSRFSFFLLAIGFFGLANFFIFNDLATVWPGAEAHTLTEALKDDQSFYFPAELMAQVPRNFPYWLFAVRLLSLAPLLLALIIFIARGSRIFGQRAIHFAVLVVLASFFLPIQGKLATGDGFALLGQLLLWFYSIQHLRTPENTSWAALFTASAVAAFAAPVSTLVFVLILSLAWWRWHPKGNQIWRWPGLYAVLILSPLGWWLAGASSFHLPYLSWGMQWGDYIWLITYSFLGMLPFAGFLVAAMRDLVFKLKRGEELSIVLLVSLLAAFWGQSLLFPLLLAFMAAKQMISYFGEHYPWRDWVRTGAMLQLVFMFVFIVMVLIGGYLSLEGQGFRAAIGCSFAYWMFSLVGVIGLFGMRRDLAWGGPVMAGVLSLLFFWVQLYPFWETQRNWPSELVELAQRDTVSTLVLPPDPRTDIALPYLLRQQIDATFVESISSDSYRHNSSAKDRWRILPALDSLSLAPEPPLHIIQGRDHRLRLVSWWVYSE